LNTPIGHVEQTITDILKRNVSFSVIEQTPIGKTEYLRKIIIATDQFPIVSATVRFDSKIIPQYILTELLRKKEGIGTILQKHHIIAHRRSIVITISSDGKKITRNYEIMQNNSVWFQISEEIRLDLLYACQNG
jgi:chorismate-pyruvate lyase